MRIGFLFNHEALHQVRHTAPVIAALARRDEAQVTVLTSTVAEEAEVRALIGVAADRVGFVRLGIGRGAGLLDAGLRGIAPFRRVALLRHNLGAFAALDVLVVPETTSLLLRDRLGLKGVGFVWIPHGAGDRSIGFRAVTRGFDLVLLSGAKVRDRMLAAGLISADTHTIVGYPKFDTADPSTPLPSPFAGSRPTVLYNPHFEPALSSWYDWGERVIDWFTAQTRFNLVVAPHVMLFRRRIHASVEHRRLRWRRDRLRAVLPPQVMFDAGSPRSVDMTYARGADIYLGDVSSQIYEWIARPRPAIFLNPARIAWRDDPNFAHWHLGEVIERVADLGPALDRALADPNRYAERQAAAFRQTFDVGPASAGERAADAILAHFGPR